MIIHVVMKTYLEIRFQQHLPPDSGLTEFSRHISSIPSRSNQRTRCSVTSGPVSASAIQNKPIQTQFCANNLLSRITTPTYKAFLTRSTHKIELWKQIWEMHFIAIYSAQFRDEPHLIRNSFLLVQWRQFSAQIHDLVNVKFIQLIELHPLGWDVLLPTERYNCKISTRIT